MRLFRKTQTPSPTIHLNGSGKNLQAVRRLEAVADRLELLVRRAETQLDKREGPGSIPTADDREGL